MLSTPLQCPKFRFDVLFISYDRVKSQFQAEGFQKCELSEELSDVVHCLRKLQKFITFSSFSIFEPLFRRKFRLDVLFISYDRVKSQFQAEGFQKCELQEILSDVVHCLRKLQKFITSSIFIGLRPFSKHGFQNFVGYIFASGPESRLCSEDFGLWVFLSTAHGNKLNFRRNQKRDCQSQTWKIHNLLIFYPIASVLSALRHKFHSLRFAVKIKFEFCIGRRVLVVRIRKTRRYLRLLLVVYIHFHTPKLRDTKSFH